MKRQYVYVLYGVSARRLSEEDIQKNYEIFKVQSPHPEKVTMDYYINVMKELYHEPIDIAISREEIAFFIDEAEALNCAKKNICDYNDGGSYNYGMVERLPLGCAYPNSCRDTMYWLFKYDRETDMYVPISLDADEITTAIWHRYDMMHDYRDDEEDYLICESMVDSLKQYYGGDNDDVPIHENVIPTLKRILYYVKENGYVYPELFPYAGGDGAQFEWHMKDVYFEIDVDSRGISILAIRGRKSASESAYPISKSNLNLEEANKYVSAYVDKREKKSINAED